MEVKNNINIKNKKASFEYEFLEKYNAGIRLTGTEIKSIRSGKANINDAFCMFVRNELFVRNMHVTEYAWGSYNNHEPKRDRKLLLNRNELNKLLRKSKDKGLAIIALRLFVNDKGLAKLEISLARGKKQFDKREDIKKRDTERELDRARKF